MVRDFSFENHYPGLEMRWACLLLLRLALGDEPASEFILSADEEDVSVDFFAVHRARRAESVRVHAVCSNGEIVRAVVK